jgi:hypothetical protein
VETQIRDFMSEKMVAEETIQGLQLKVIQLEITLSKKHCKVSSELQGVPQLGVQFSFACQSVKTDQIFSFLNIF